MNYGQLKTDLMKLGIHEYNAEVIANHLGLDAQQRMSIEQAQQAEEKNETTVISRKASQIIDEDDEKWKRI